MLKNKRFLFTAGLLALSFLLPITADAANMSPTSVRLGRLGISASTGNDVLLTFKTVTSPGSGGKVVLTFPTGFTIATNASAGATTVISPAPTGATALPATISSSSTGAGAGAGGSITITSSGTMAAATVYYVDVPTGTVTNPSTPGQFNVGVATQTSGGTATDSATDPVYIYGGSNNTTSNADQVTVNASVAPSFTFSLSANSDTVPQVDQTHVQTSPGVNMVVSTNSPLGYTAYVKSANGSLVSPTATNTPITTGTYDNVSDTITAGTTEYAFQPVTGAAASLVGPSSVLTYAAEYAGGNNGAGTNGPYQGGAFNGTNFAPFVSRNGYTSGDTVSLRERVSVGPTIGFATDYTDTLTIVAAGNY